MIEVDPRIAAVFNNSTFVSRKYSLTDNISNTLMIFIYNIESKGSAYGMMKIGSKRRKTKTEIEELKEEERLKE